MGTSDIDKMTETLQMMLVISGKLWYTKSNLKGWEDINYGKTDYWRYWLW